jgi:hypothetical protein
VILGHGAGNAPGCHAHDQDALSRGARHESIVTVGVVFLQAE